MKNLILVNPQWQGGGDIITYNGAKEFEKLYLNGKEYQGDSYEYGLYLRA